MPEEISVVDNDKYENGYHPPHGQADRVWCGLNSPMVTMGEVDWRVMVEMYCNGGKLLYNASPLE